MIKMFQIWKYIIHPNNLIHRIPKGGITRHVDEQNGDICVWVEVDPEQPKVSRHFEVYGTGHPIKYDMGASRDYLGTVKLEGGALVFHVYEYTGI
jgi:hypothetical protein